MKFTIRDLFLVTAIAAILTAWGVDHWRQASQIKKLREPDYSIYRRSGRQVSLPIGDYEPANPSQFFRMKYSLRSLMIVAILAPAVLAIMYWLFVELPSLAQDTGPART